MIKHIETQPPLAPAIPPLENGDRLDQKTFHERYEAMPEGTWAELIGGIVYMSSPLRRPHSRGHLRLGHWLLDYERATPGVEAHDNATVILGDESEPQPDLCLLLLKGGQTRDEDEYIVGSPELGIEVAASSESIDLHVKKEDYERAGLREYIVVATRIKKVYWFILRDGKFEDLPSGTDGILRSETFPGLWLDPVALLTGDDDRWIDVARRGRESPEHAVFVATLADRGQS